MNMSHNSASMLKNFGITVQEVNDNFRRLAATPEFKEFARRLRIMTFLTLPDHIILGKRESWLRRVRRWFR